MITSNIDIQDGLVNGACGTLDKISICNKTNVPIYLWLNFDNNKVGNIVKSKFTSFMKSNNINANLVPIQKIQTRFNTKSYHEIFREEFPVVPAEAITIHKS